MTLQLHTTFDSLKWWEECRRRFRRPIASRCRTAIIPDSVRWIAGRDLSERFPQVKNGSIVKWRLRWTTEAPCIMPEQPRRWVHPECDVEALTIAGSPTKGGSPTAARVPQLARIVGVLLLLTHVMERKPAKETWWWNRERWGCSFPLAKAIKGVLRPIKEELVECCSEELSSKLIGYILKGNLTGLPLGLMSYYPLL